VPWPRGAHPGAPARHEAAAMGEASRDAPRYRSAPRLCHGRRKDDPSCKRLWLGKVIGGLRIW
jgi:hypothetical protein